MSVLVCIPANYNSKRAPGKPLYNETGKTLLAHTYELALKTGYDVIVLSNDININEYCSNYNINIESAEGNNGTERIADYVIKNDPSHTTIVNIQVDEPLLSHLDIIRCAEYCEEHNEVTTLAFESMNRTNENTVKVVVDKNDKAMYFSRAQIPYPGHNTENVSNLIHVGLYCYPTSKLFTYGTEPSEYEKYESLEQLRFLHHGTPIHVIKTTHHSFSINTVDDYVRFIDKYRQRSRKL